MNPGIPVEEAAYIAQTRSIPTEEFLRWKVDRAVNRVDPNNNGKHLLVLLSESAAPGLNAATLDAAIFSSSPVLGLRPVRAARSRTSNVPKPGNVSESAFF